MIEMEYIHGLLKNPADDKLAIKFSQSLQFLSDSVKLGELVNETPVSDLSKQIKNKIETYLKNIQNIFSEIVIELQKSQEKINRNLQNLLNSNLDINDTARKFFLQNQELREKIKDVENSMAQMKNKIKENNHETTKMFDEKIGNMKINELMEENEALKSLNESLARRMKYFQGDYNHSYVENSLNVEDDKCILYIFKNFNTVLQSILNKNIKIFKFYLLMFLSNNS